MGELSLDKIKKIKKLILHTKSLEKTIEQILNNKTKEIARYSSFKQLALVYNDLVKEAKSFLTLSNIYTMNTKDMKGSSNTVWPIQKEIMESTLISTRMLMTTLESNIDFVVEEIDNVENFINTKLRSVIFETPEKEKEVQRGLETLFVGKGYNKGIDYDRETGKFNYSGREYIPDFILPKLRMCIEVKLLKDNSRKSRIIEEINADISAYSKEYENLLFVVYDLGIIRDKIEFCRDIENKGAKIIVVKH